MTLDLARLRSQFPALDPDRGIAHFDGPGGSQVPMPVAHAVAATMTAGLGNRGTITGAELKVEQVVADARRAMADLLGADPRGIVFGRSMTQLTFDLSRVLSAAWGPGDEVVVTRLDHDANIRPWVYAAERCGATLRWLDFDPATGELDDIATVLSERTVLVAVTGASNLIGTRPDVAAVTSAARAVGALSYVDAVHLVPHSPVSFEELGADLLACSPYKFFGPHLGALAASPQLLEGLRPQKLLPSSDAVPERFELGTLPYEQLAGVTAAVDFIAGIASGASGRRERIGESMSAVVAHEADLLQRLLEGLTSIDDVRVHGGAPTRRTPTVLFSVDGRSGRQVHQGLSAVGVNAPASNFYAIEACRRLGLGEDGAVRVGLAAYSTDEDVDRLLAGLSDLAE